MTRKSKIETEKQANNKGAELAVRGAGDSVGAEAKAIGVAPKPKRKKAAPKKISAPAIKLAAPRKASSPALVQEPSDEEIRIRAYFIAERRIQLSLQGDSAHDWIEARRQLFEEANRTAS